MNRSAVDSPSSEIDQHLYAKRQKIYPRQVHGVFAWMRTSAVFALLGLYYGLPWLQFDDRQAVLFDLPNRKFYLFGMVIWPQDFVYLAALLIVAALALFFFTALAGRLWCGYACPQTVWTEVFLWMERRIEGDRPKQMKLDKAPWTARKVAIKSLKHGVWIVFSLWTGFTFVGFFTPITELAGKVVTFSTGPWETFWILFYGFATYGNAGWLREQVCIYMCPYARFQSAMFDRNTMIISYDVNRGEPRGSRKRSADLTELSLGHCIDCTLCVQVCPTGIDIRDGLQYQCIGCAACIDACDGVMEKMNYPKGLVRYTTESAMEGQTTRVLRPRVIVYAVILIGITTAIGIGLFNRALIGVDVIRDRNTLYRETAEGLVENVYTLKILNKDQVSHRFELSLDGLAGASLLMEATELDVPSGTVANEVVRVRIDPASLTRSSSEIEFVLSTTSEPTLQTRETARFLGPVSAGL
jgi:cytochrome c oxidase accessory protein FixG